MFHLQPDVLRTEHIWCPHEEPLQQTVQKLARGNPAQDYGVISGEEELTDERLFCDR